MSLGEAITTCLSKYAIFSGRASRSEYWYFVLFLFIAGFVTASVDLVIFGDPEPVELFSGIFLIATFLPSIAVTVRRLHDRNYSGWWLAAPPGIFCLGIMLEVFWGELLALEVMAFLLVFLSVGSFLLVDFIWMVLPGNTGENRFGPSPFSGADRQS